MRASLIMPFYGKWAMTHQRLGELYKFVNPSALKEIVLINDKPGDCKRKEVAFWGNIDTMNIKYHHNKENLGFGGSMNKGAELATGKILVFFSNDVVVSGDFLTQIIGALSVDKRRFVGNILYDYPTGWNFLPIKLPGKTLFPYLGGDLLACTSKCWEELGGFDPIYYPYDFEDVDICTMAVHKGYKLFALNSPYVRHMSGTTIREVNSNRENITKKNQQKFIKKWKELL